MGFVGFKTNQDEEKELQELEDILRAMDPLQRISDRSKAIKEGVRIALFHLKGSYLYKWSLTKPKKGQTAMQETRYIERIQGSDISLDGSRKVKK